MKPIEVITGLLTITTLLAVVARRWHISYPILLLLAGLAIAWIPGLPPVRLTPDSVFFIFLPPLIYSSAWTINNADLKRYRRAVVLLAVGLVVFTATMVGLVAVAFLPGFTLAEGIVLGAIVAPPDEIAATSVMRNLRIPKRILTVLEGESLVNDASSLIVYRYALAAVLTNTFSPVAVGWAFIQSVVLSTAIGLAVGWLMQYVHRWLQKDPITNSAVTLLTPYGVYLLTEYLELSGVLAVVITGLFLSGRERNFFSNQARLQAYSLWQTVTFLLNGLVFILLGLQLPAIIRGLNSVTVPQAIGYGALVAVAVIVVRIVWTFPGAYLPRLLFRSIREREPRPEWQQVSVVAWAGMRGAVSLAAALGLPQSMPNRDLIVFLAFSVIFATLVVQGLSLPLVIRWLGVHDTTDQRQQELDVRKKLATKAIDELEAQSANADLPDSMLTPLRLSLQQRADLLDGQGQSSKPDDAHKQRYLTLIDLQLQLLAAQRELLDEEAKRGEMDDDLVQQLTQEIDLEGSRLHSTARTARPDAEDDAPIV